MTWTHLYLTRRLSPGITSMSTPDRLLCHVFRCFLPALMKLQSKVNGCRKLALCCLSIFIARQTGRCCV